jgi:hypothetical protein
MRVLERPELREGPVRGHREGHDTQAGEHRVTEHDPAVDPGAKVRQLGPDVFEEVGLVIHRLST